MKLTVEFDSLEEFQQHFNLESLSNEALAVAIAQLGNKVDGLYKSGESIEVDKITADINDIDNLKDDYSVELYEKATAKVSELLKLDSRRAEIYLAHLAKLTGDNEVRTGKADHVYANVIRWAENAIDGNR